MNILFLSARFPIPPIKGDQRRGYHHLRFLSRRHRITLLSFTDRSSDQAIYHPIASLGVEIFTVPWERISATFQLIRGAFTASSYPFQVLLYQSAIMHRVLAELLERYHFDIVHVQLARMAPYFELKFEMPRVIDLIDALSLNMKRRFQVDKGLPKLASYIEWRKLLRYEQKICQMYDQVIVVSDEDRIAIGDFPNLNVLPTVIELDQFPMIREGREPRTLVFSGNMGYFPNIHAVLWFVDKVLPLIRSSEPDVCLLIVGANPPPAIRALSRDPNIQVTGFVPAIQPFLARATLAIAPLHAGSGMQYKVIEAMACGTPIVATPFALGGIKAEDGKHLLLAETPESFAKAILRLLRDHELRERLAIAGRTLVEEYYTPEGNLPTLESIYERAISQRTRSSTLRG